MRRRQRLVGQPRRFVDMRKRPHRRSVDDQPVSGNDFWPQIVVKEVPPCRIARNDRIGDSRLRERILHRLRSSAGAQHQRRFGKIVAEQKAQRKANPLYVGIETRQPPAVAAHAIHGPDPCGLFRHVVQIVENPLFVGNGHIESLQFGLRPQQFGQRLDRRQLVKRIIAPRNPLPAELSREITGREGVAERPADQPVPFHASPFLAAIRLPTYSIPQMSRNPQAQSATAHPTCASVPVNSVKVAGSTLRSTSGCAAP